MPLTSPPHGEIVGLRISADDRFKKRLNEIHADVESKKIHGVSNVDWCLLHLLSKARDAIRSGPEPQLDIAATREYILDTYADEGTEHWRNVFDQALTLFEKLNTPCPDSP